MRFSRAVLLMLPVLGLGACGSQSAVHLTSPGGYWTNPAGDSASLCIDSINQWDLHLVAGGKPIGEFYLTPDGTYAHGSSRGQAVTAKVHGQTLTLTVLGAAYTFPGPPVTQADCPPIPDGIAIG